MGLVTQVMTTSVVVALCGGGSLADARRPGTLAEDLAYLRSQRVDRVGRDALADAYKQFIAKAGRDPLAVEGMLDLAGMYASIALPDQGVVQDPDAALQWFRKAGATAPRGSETWIQAKLNVARILTMVRPAEAREVLQEMRRAASKDDTVTQMTIELELASTYRAEGKLGMADQHARTVLDWHRDPKKRMPRERLVKRAVDGQIRAASRIIIAMWSGAPIPAEDRIWQILKLWREYGNYSFLSHDASQAIAELERGLNKKVSSLLEKRIASLEDLPTTARGNAPGLVPGTRPQGTSDSGQLLGPTGVGQSTPSPLHAAGVVCGVLGVVSGIAVILILRLRKRRARRDWAG